MSFSGEVKEELSEQISLGRHCQIAEMAAIINMCGRVSHIGEGQYQILVHTENIAVARKIFLLLQKTFDFTPAIIVRRNVYLKKSRTYSILVTKPKDALRVLKAIKWTGADGVSGLIVQMGCCKRAFIRGAFLSAGSISAPEKFYHFEIVCSTEKKAEQLQEMIRGFSIDAKIVQRKKYFVVYIKEGAQIVEILNVMEAHRALMNLENIRIVKEMRNSVNRQVNCETANINKTVSASVKQVDDIKYLQETIGLESLSAGLEEIAILRLENQQATLKELGLLLSPPVGKSGVNHRLRKLCDIADELREDKEEKRYDQ